MVGGRCSQGALCTLAGGVMLLGLAEKNRLYVGDAWLGRKRGKEIGKADDCIGRKKLPLVEGGERIVNGQYKSSNSYTGDHDRFSLQDRCALDFLRDHPVPSPRDLPLHWVLKSSNKMITTMFSTTQRIQRDRVHDCSREDFSRLSPLRLHLRRRRRVIRHLLALLLMRHWSLLYLRRLLALDLSLLSLVRPTVVAHGLLQLVLGKIALLGLLVL